MLVPKKNSKELKKEKDRGSSVSQTPANTRKKPDHILIKKKINMLKLSIDS